MKPPPFEYSRPGSVEEAVEILASAGDDARVLAGGQSLVPLLNMRLARPGRLVDINGLDAERYLTSTGDALEIGCLARHTDFEHNPEVEARLPILGQAVKEIASPAVRNRGTFCGSLCHNDPAAEWPLMAVLLEARLHTLSASGARQQDAAAFLDRSSPHPEGGELLRRVELPVPPAHWGWGFVEFNRRPGDVAIVSAAALLAVEAGRVTNARLAFGGVAETVRRVPEIERLLEGEAPGEALWAQAADSALTLLDPATDLQASAAFRRHLAGQLTRRVLAEAAARAK